MAGELEGSRAWIRGRQTDGLAALLAEVYPANPFYRDRLAAAGIPGDSAPSLERFSDAVPFTTKAELVADQAAHPPYGTNLTCPVERYTRCHQTSGTTGAPLRWLDTPESWDWMVGQWAEVHRAAGVQAGDRVFFAFSFGPFIGFWLAFEAAGRLGALGLPGGGLTSVARLRTLLDHQATVLCCTPTYALHLAEVAAQEDIDLGPSRVRTIIVAGEPGGSIPAVRQRIAERWRGARVFDHHGMTEVGPVTHECPARPGVLHVLEPGYYAEVIDPATGREAAPGDTGELVLTPLGRAGMPLLRYRTGDLVRPAFPASTTDASAICACGRQTLALEGGILGRVDDMVIVRGVNIFPGAIEAVLRRFSEVAEYQVRLTEPEGLVEMTIRIEPSRDCADLGGLVRRIEQAFQVAFALRLPVIPVPPGSLPRFELKARRWVKEKVESR